MSCFLIRSLASFFNSFSLLSFLVRAARVLGGLLSFLYVFSLPFLVNFFLVHAPSSRRIAHAPSPAQSPRRTTRRAPPPQPFFLCRSWLISCSRASLPAMFLFFEFLVSACSRALAAADRTRPRRRKKLAHSRRRRTTPPRAARLPAIFLSFFLRVLGFLFTRPRRRAKKLALAARLPAIFLSLPVLGWFAGCGES
jgi:hypothetical protein